MANEVMKKKLKLKLKLKLKKKSSNSKSEWSGSTSSTVTTENDQRLKVIDVVSKFHDMLKLKVVRKRRSKSLCMSNCQKISSGKQAVKVEPSASVSASSCLSSGSSSVISTAASSGSVINRRGNNLFHTLAKETKKKPVFGSTHMRRRAEAILKVLSSHGRASEVKIRELLGDSPSTSKALRILLNLEQVKRTGAGGRTDPYIYMHVGKFSKRKQSVQIDKGRRQGIDYGEVFRVDGCRGENSSQVSFSLSSDCSVVLPSTLQLGGAPPPPVAPYSWGQWWQK